MPKYNAHYVCGNQGGEGWSFYSPYRGLVHMAGPDGFINFLDTLVQHRVALDQRYPLRNETPPDVLKREGKPRQRLSLKQMMVVYAKLAATK